MAELEPGVGAGRSDIFFTFEVGFGVESVQKLETESRVGVVCFQLLQPGRLVHKIQFLAYFLKSNSRKLL